MISDIYYFSLQHHCFSLSENKDVLIISFIISYFLRFLLTQRPTTNKPALKSHHLVQSLVTSIALPLTLSSSLHLQALVFNPNKLLRTMQNKSLPWCSFQRFFCATHQN